MGPPKAFRPVQPDRQPGACVRRHANPIRPRGPEARGACSAAEELRYLPVDQQARARPAHVGRYMHS